MALTLGKLHSLKWIKYDSHRERIATLLGVISSEWDACKDLEDRINNQLEIAKAHVGELHRMGTLKASILKDMQR